jgi:hypothetical protein
MDFAATSCTHPHFVAYAGKIRKGWCFSDRDAAGTNSPWGHFELRMGLWPTHCDENGLSCGCTLLERGRQRSVYTLDEVRPFLSLIRNARFEPICVAPPLRAEVVARDGV